LVSFDKNSSEIIENKIEEKSEYLQILMLMKLLLPEAACKRIEKRKEAIINLLIIAVVQSLMLN
jgi:hypothetical protein